MARLRSAFASRRWLIVLALIVLVGAGAAAFLPPAHRHAGEKEPSDGARRKIPTVEPVEGMPYTLSVPADVRQGLRIRPPHVVQRPRQTRPVVMPGSTALDPTRIGRVRTRFNAEVIEIRQVRAAERSPSGETQFREIRTGDRVKKGDTLAVVWSTDVGSRKNDLFEGLVQLWLDEQRYKMRKKLYDQGSIPLDTLNQTRRDVLTDQSAVQRAERTLRTWNVPEREIEAVREQARLAHERGSTKPDPEKEKLWPRSELVAPRDGTLVERNVTRGEFVADNTINLFTIADVDTLLIMVNPPEDLLPDLLKLEPDRLRWTIHTAGAPPIEGPIDEFSYLIDPNQHTAVVKGYVRNPGRRLRAGQYVTATVELPPPVDVVEVPLTALAEDGVQSFVFVQPEAGKHIYTLRRVKVTHRFEKTAYVSSRLTPGEQALSPEDEAKRLLPLRELHVGERVLGTGVLELRNALDSITPLAQLGH